MNDIYDMMLSEYDLSTIDNQRNANYEVMQQVILSGLYRGGFFKKAAFYGDYIDLPYCEISLFYRAEILYEQMFHNITISCLLQQRYSNNSTPFFSDEEILMIHHFS